VIEKRIELTGSGRGRTVVVVVCDREEGCDEPDYQEPDLRGELDLLLWEEERNVQMRIGILCPQGIGQGEDW